jgi:carboxylesterase
MRIGFESEKGGTGVLLLHGLSGTPWEVRPLGDYLAERGYSVLGPWLPGHGTSPRDLDRTSWRDWAEGAREAYGRLARDHREIFVAGLSMGGDLALHLAAEVSPAGVLSMSAPVRIFDFRFNGIAFFRFLQWRTSNLTGGILDPQAPPHQTYPYVSTRSLYELKKFMEVVRSELPRITVPALVLQGRKDSMVPPVNGELIHQALGSSLKHLLYLERSDHVVTMDFDRKILFEKALRFIQTGGRSLDGATG